MDISQNLLGLIKSTLGNQKTGGFGDKPGTQLGVMVSTRPITYKLQVLMFTNQIKVSWLIDGRACRRQGTRQDQSPAMFSVPEGI